MTEYDYYYTELPPSANPIGDEVTSRPYFTFHPDCHQSSWEERGKERGGGGGGGGRIGWIEALYEALIIITS